MENKSKFSFHLNIPVGSAVLAVLVRGNNMNNPVLVILPAGPGFPGIPEADRLEKSLHLEEKFTVAYLDPRGCGKSFSPRLPAKSLSLGQMITDTRIVIDAIRKRLNKSEVMLLGFSIGGSIAMLTASSNPEGISAIVAVGPDIVMREAEEYAYSFALEEAARTGNRKAIKQLQKVGPPPHNTVAAFQTRVRWVTQFGGIQQDENFTSLLRKTLGALLSCKAYTILDKLNALRGINFSQKIMLPLLSGFDIRQLIIELPVRLFIAQGLHDKAAPAASAEKFFAALNAPAGKRIVYFSHSAHNPHLEEPDKFTTEIIDALI
jgi:pimeloyl-ACP methyl ester carboxylesterase